MISTTNRNPDIYAFLCNNYPDLLQMHNEGTLRGFSIVPLLQSDITDVSANEPTTTDINPVLQD